LKKVKGLLKKIEIKSSDLIVQATEVMGEAITADKLIHVIGTGGHSNIGAVELVLSEE